MPYKDKTKQLEYQRKWMEIRRATFFTNKQCVKCGSTNLLELDHVDPSEKEDHRIWSWSEDRQKQELLKCQVLCSTCHMEKTNIENRAAFTKEITHGTISGYQNKGCRCSICVMFYRSNRSRARLRGGS
jgi:5-methylcytosine-specific restriction endonuclease McrA